MLKVSTQKLPKISVIIPNYNYGSFIEETICSVINQNYKNLEIIVIDGGSTDNSVEIIKKYNSQINYWISEKDEGQADAINKGLLAATGDYVAYINSDDVYLKNAFHEIFSNEKTIESDFIYGDVLIGNDLKNSKPNRTKKNKLELFSLIQFYYNAKYVIPSQSVFIKRDFLIKNNLNYLDKSLHYCMDLDWYCRIAMFNPTVYKYQKIHSFFRINPYTKTSSQSFKMKNEAIQIAFFYIKYLDLIEIKSFFNIRLVEKILFKKFKLGFNPSFLFLLKVIFKTNFFALTDRRFLGLLKKKILFK